MFSEIEAPKRNRTLPKFLYQNEIEKILASIETKTATGKRDLAIMEILYGSGIRVSELCNLKITDIDFSNQMLLVFGKGHKERYVPLSTKAVEALKAYLYLGRPQLELKNELNKPDKLFLNHLGGNLTPRGVRVILNNIMDKASETLHISPHMLRHTFASHLLDGGRFTVRSGNARTCPFVKYADLYPCIERTVEKSLYAKPSQTKEGEK